jgi:hypothetical protein
MSAPDTREAPAAGVGKIGRLPLATRREVARRLLDHETAASVIAWLSSKPEVLAIWADHFDGAAATSQNISEWKKGSEFAGYVRQLDEIERAKALSEFSVRLASAAGGMASGAVASLGGRLMEMMDSADPDTMKDLVAMATQLRAAEQNDRLLGLKERIADAKDRSLDLTERQIRFRECTRFLKWFADGQAQEIAAGAGSKDDKIAKLLEYMDRQEKETTA